MRSSKVLGFCLLGMFCSLAIPARGQADTVETALTQCLGSMPGAIPPTTPPADLPPGLSRGKNVHVEPLQATAGKAYTYEGTSPHEIACGIAIYGPVPETLKAKLVRVIDGYTFKWTRHDPGPYRLSGAPAEETYWGDPNAPGVMGVLLLSRRPSAGAPTLEIDYHKGLLF